MGQVPGKADPDKQEKWLEALQAYIQKAQKGECHLLFSDAAHFTLHKTLSRKPGAIAGSVAISQAPECIREMYARHFTTQGREFIELMMFCAESKRPDTTLHAVCCQVEKRGVKEITAAHVKMILTNKKGEEVPENKKTQPPSQ